ncbi:MAG: hypothetical protein JSU81_00970 [Candidatus Coatesbacteria bacterium]|nr:MAG: hypothetical protein JSU81_00970 [Candidatus Coatesbacteria bacterium]
MKRISTAMVLILASATVALAHGSYVRRVPNGSAFSCNTCHTEKKFQDDFKNNGLKWNRALAIKDSDGDGASNGVELQDPGGTWRENNPDPKVPGWSTYNPDSRGSRPPYAPVEPTSMGRVKALFK